METASNFIDLSHTVEHGLITYKGLPAPVICDYWTREESRKSYDGQAEFHIGKIEMVANTGTYIDSPFPRFPDGHDLSELRLDQLAGLEGVLVRIAPGHGRAIDMEHIPDGRPFKFFAVPVKVKDFGTFPVRAFALVE